MWLQVGEVKASTERQISWGLRMTARTGGQLLRKPRSLWRFPGGGMTGSGLPVHFMLGSLARAPSCTPGHMATGTDQCSRLPRTPPHPTSPCSHLTSRVWPLRAPELESPDVTGAGLGPAGNATHGGRGEPLRAGHREPQLPVRLPVQLVRPQEARPCGRKWSAVYSHLQLKKPSLGSSCSGPCKKSQSMANNQKGR